MMLVRGQCRFCPKIIRKFGDLIKHESGHLAKLKESANEQKEEVENNVILSKPSDPPDEDKASTLNVNSNHISESSTVLNIGSLVEVPDPKQAQSGFLIPKRRGRPPKSMSGAVTKDLKLNQRNTSKMTRQRKTKAVPAKLDKPSALGDIEKKIRIREELEKGIIAQLNEFDWRGEFLKLEGPGKIFQCLRCQKQVRASNRLKFHQMGHTGEKPFAAICCSMTFTRPSNRDTHEKGHLTKLENNPAWSYEDLKKGWNRKSVNARRPEDEEIAARRREYDWTKDWNKSKEPGSTRVFKCCHCGYVTPEKAYLLHHTFIHSGEKPYRCKFCPFMTRTPCLRGSHERWVHGRTHQNKIRKDRKFVPGLTSQTLKEAKNVKLALQSVENDPSLSLILSQAKDRLKMLKGIAQKLDKKPEPYMGGVSTSFELEKIPVLKLIRIEQDQSILKAHPAILGLGNLSKEDKIKDTTPKKIQSPIKKMSIQFNEEDLLQIELAMNEITNKLSV